MRAATALALLLSLAAPVLIAANQVPAESTSGISPLLIVLEETGQNRDGLPVLRVHPDGEHHAKVLSTGFSGRFLRLYRCAQMLANPDEAPEPAFLLLSSNEGGFPRTGFFLGAEDKRATGYVDLPSGRRLTGRLGAMDQLFPHELAHLVLGVLVGKIPPGGTTQIHSVGVRTDPATAFNEGFAEHIQILAVDDPEADQETRAAAADLDDYQRTLDRLTQYRRELTARWAPASSSRMTFPLWFSGSEQKLRYHAVKTNSFARRAAVPSRLLRTDDPYRAYLLTSILPDAEASEPRSVAEMMSTEGVVSALFHRLMTNQLISQTYLETAVYERFGLQRDDITPLENSFLKLFWVLHTHKPHSATALLRAWELELPADAPALRSIVDVVLLGQPLSSATEIWLAAPTFRTGTSLFDQRRAVPRVHTFDLNAGSPVDLLTVPGIELETAKAILLGAPYSEIGDLKRAGVSAPVIATIREMAQAMERQRVIHEESEDSLSLTKILMPYIWRALLTLIIVSLMGGALLHWVLHISPKRAVIGTVVASLATLLPGWLAGTGALAFLGPILLFGIPHTLFRAFSRQQSLNHLGRPLIAWTLAALPSALALMSL